MRGKALLVACALVVPLGMVTTVAPEQVSRAESVVAVEGPFVFADVPPPDDPPPRSVKCCDGTLSPTCVCCGKLRGCCSRHKGVCGCE